ncbi:MAG: SprB repeat-containing protein [Saprospiraceae bacterium]|nr:SprB repeat-containing protein [Saprospiraceae bacterium]
MKKAITLPNLPPFAGFRLLAFWLLAAAWPVVSSAQSLEVSLPDYAICLGSNVVLAPQVSGGTPPYTYVWSPAGSLSCGDCENPFASPLATTVYSLTVTDQGGEEAVASTTVQVDTLPPTILNVEICEGDCFVFGTEELCTSGTYEYVLTSVEGCDSMVVVNLTVTPGMSASVVISDTAVCLNSSITLTATLAGNTTGCTYQWQVRSNGISGWANVTGATNLSLNRHFGWTYPHPPLTVEYRFISTCPGTVCNTDTSNIVSVTRYGDPVVNITPLYNIVCINEPAVLTANLTGGAGHCSWQWSSSPNYEGPYTDIPGATNNTYEPPADAIGVMHYLARVSCSGPGCDSPLFPPPPTIPAKVAVVEQAPSLIIAPAISPACASDSLTLTATTFYGADSCIVQWQIATSPQGPFVNIPGANGADYNPPTDSLAGTRFYRAQYSCEGIPPNYSPPNVRLAISNAYNLSAGEQFCVDMVAWDEVWYMRFVSFVDFDPAKLKLISAQNFGFPGLAFNLNSGSQSYMHNPGLLWVFWPNSLSSVLGPLVIFPAGSIMMSLCFEVLEAGAPTSIGLGILPDQIERVFPPPSISKTHPQRGIITFEPNCFSATSNIIPVYTPPSIALDTTDQMACIGQTLEIQVSEINTTEACMVRWQNAPTADGPWADIPDAEGPSYLPPTHALDTTYYRATMACQVLCGVDSVLVSGAVRMIVVEEMTVTITEEPPQCPNNRSTLNVQVGPASGNFTFTWSNGTVRHSNNGQSSLTNLPAGTYCVTVTADNGCLEASACFTASQAPVAIAVTSSITQIPCTSSPQAGGIAILSTTGGTPPYTYSWSNGATTDFLTDLPAGSYQLTVTDANGCLRPYNYQIVVLLAANAGPDKVIDCNNSQVQLQGSSPQFGPHITYAWLAPDGTIISDEPGITVSEGGLYRFRVTDADAGCYSEDEVFVSDFSNIIESDFQTALVACNTIQLSGIVPPVYFGPIHFEWTTPDGSISSGPHFIATQSGVYQLRTTLPNLSCESTVTRFIDVGNDECATISGRIAYDTGEDCIADADELGLSSWVLQAVGSAGAFHAISGANGDYQFHLPLGQYTVAAMPPSAAWELCAPSHPVALTAAGQVSTLDIPAQFVAICPELDVVLSAPFLRRCFSSKYYVSVCNQGTETVPAPVVSLTLDGYLDYQAAQIAPASIDSQTIHWVLPALAPSQCMQFWVEARVSCDAELGQAHCSMVVAWPDSLCTPAATGWSGANLEVSGECTDGEVLFRVRNTGTGDLTDPVQYIVIEDVVMLMQMPNTIDNLPSGAEQVLEFPANGATYIFSVEQAPMHPFGNPVTVAVEGCGTNDAGGFSTGFVNLLPLQTPTPASFTLCMPNIGAYDPNDKQAIPVGYGTQHFIHIGDPLSYKIRFQNTGTDTAFTVIIRDTLSPWLDITTLRPGPSSHAYRLDITGERTLVFTFDNILLPDSTTNLESSQGFVDFFIQTADSIPLLTRIENSAAIYFDFNEPVITNTVFHTVGTDFFERTTATFYPPAVRPQWRVFPNPTHDEATLVLEEAAAGVKTAWLYDAFGRQVLRLPFEGDRCLLQLAGMAPGWYALRVTDAAGRSLGTGRVVLR